MKTKFIYLFIAFALFSFAGNAQFRSISIIGSGVGGWNLENDHDLQTSDGITYTLVDLHIGEGEIKFREGHCWESACAVGTVNVFGWGPVSNTDNGFTVGTSNTAPGQNGPNIKATAGVWNVTFHLDTQSWEFTPGTPNPTVKLFGSAVDPSAGILMDNPSADGINYVLKKIPFAGGGTAQFELNLTPATTPATLQVLAGSAWPTGIADSDTALIPVDATPHDYDVSLNIQTGVYTFAIATFPQIAIVGSGSGGWPTGAAGEVDSNPMTTTDGDAYAISHLALTTGAIKFRLDNAWNTNWGGSAWPSGSTGGGDIPSVGGNYNGTFNKTTGAYAFTLNTIAVVGSGVGGWPTGAAGEIDVNAMTSEDGVHYTLNGIVLITGEIKFRENNGWDTNWGGVGFPSGTNGGNNISSSAGTYNLTFNRITGVYRFVSTDVVYTYYADVDGDGYGAGSAVQLADSTAPAGYSLNSTDCNDSNAAIHPGAIEIFDTIDNDCDGLKDEGTILGAPVVANKSVCLKTTGVTPTATALPGYALQWYTNATKGTAATITPTVVTTAAKVISYYVSQKLGLSESPRALVTVTVNAIAATPTKLVLTNGSATAVTTVGVFVGATKALTLTATAVGASSYNWTLPAGVVRTDVSGESTNSSTTSTTSSIYVKFTASASTTNLVVGVSMVNASGCSSAAAKTLTLKRALPTAVSKVTGSTKVCDRSQGFTYTITPNATAASYLITAPTGSVVTSATSTSNATNVLTTSDLAFKVVYGASGTSLTVQSINGTGNGATKSLPLKRVACTAIPANTTKVAPVASAFKVVAYPNPSTEGFKINSSNKKPFGVQVYDMLGRSIEQRQLKSDSQIGANYARGIYNVIVTQDAQVKTLRLIKK